MNFPVHSSCRLCTLHSHVKSVGIPSRHVPYSLPPSPSTPAIFLIGQNPGFDEDQSGQCFVGPTGRLTHLTYIGQILDKKGHPLDGQEVGPGLWRKATIYLGNVARCATWSDMKCKDRHYSACSPYLLDDIRAIHPTCSKLYLLLCGAPSIFHTYKLLTGQGIKTKAAMDRAGEILPIPPVPSVTAPDSPDPLRGAEGIGATVQVFSTYHPAFVIRKNVMISAVIDHIQLLVDALDGISVEPTSPTIVPPQYPEDFMKLIRSPSCLPSLSRQGSGMLLPEDATPPSQFSPAS